MHKIKNSIELAISLVREAYAAAFPFPYLLEIAASLEAMKEALRAEHGLTRERRSSMAGALERLVTDDSAFSESLLGRTILGVSNEFALHDPTRDVDDESSG